MAFYRPVADHALLVEFATTITEAAHAQVLALDQALAAQPFLGFCEAIPAFVNLLVDFDPTLTDHAAVEAHLRGLAGQTHTPAAPTTREVLVCYDDAPDLDAVARQTGLSAEAVIQVHLSGDYRVFLYGFAPGYAYMGGLPEALRLDRKASPVRGVPAGSIIIAGAQCLITTLTMPTGWWIIGRTPTRVLTGDEARPFLFDVGDHVRFRRISQADCGALA
jgi:inhibitor of KinA